MGIYQNGMFLMLKKWVQCSKKCKLFNQNINSWNVSKVEDMERMFMGCEKKI